MKEYYNRVVGIFFLLLILGACSTQSKEQKKVVKKESSKEQKKENHEFLIDSLIETLTGIEYHFVKYKEVFNNKQYITDNLLTLLSHKKHKIYEDLKSLHHDKYQIKVLDSKNGFLVAQGMGVENVSYLTYWNIKDGSGDKLLAEVNRSCGPACEDDIRFFRIIKNKSGNSAYRYDKLQKTAVIQDYNNIAEQLLGHEVDDYYPISINLPRGGKNILICYAKDINLNPDDDVSLESNGSCIELVWQDEKGTFIPGEKIIQD